MRRIRIKLLAFLLVFLVFLPIFCIFLGDFLSREDYEEPLETLKKPEKAETNGVISQSVLLGYSNADKLSIFSAFSSENAGNRQITAILSSYGYLNRRVYCRLFDAEKREIWARPVSVFPEFTVKCSESPEGARFVAVTVNKKDGVGDLRKIDSRHDSSEFSVCLAPLFGDSPKILMLLEFIEFYTLQGADRFLVYTFEISPKTAEFIDFYRKSRRIEVIPMGNATKCLNRHRCRHEMQLQDCVFRTQNSAKWVATVDLDERIMPIRQDSTLLDVLNEIDSPLVSELRFRCQWTLRYSEIPAGAPKIADLPMMTWHNTSHVAPQNHTTKSIVRPSHVDSMGVHGVLKFRQSKFRVKLVEPEAAVVRHYRLVRGWSFFLKEAESFGEFRNFQLPDTLAKRLEQRVAEKIGEFSAFTGQ